MIRYDQNNHIPKLILSSGPRYQGFSRKTKKYIINKIKDFEGFFTFLNAKENTIAWFFTLTRTSILTKILILRKTYQPAVFGPCLNRKGGGVQIVSDNV